MTDLILHHYPTSPFAEKARLILGYKKLAWKSVIIPMVMPKPDVLALTGGYRKTPILQIGADIYCDTALIADVLEHLQPEPSLYPKPSKGLGCKGLTRVLAQWADTTLFWAAMAYNFQPAGAAQVFAGAPPEAAKVFAEDRQAMRGGMLRMPAADATVAYKSYLRRLSDMLDDGPFLLGSALSIADFAAYHSLWFTRTRTPAMAGIFNATPAVLAWMDRMAEIGHATFEKLMSADAIAVAAAATPLRVKNDVFQDEHGIPLGSQVVIRSENFGVEPTQGELIAATRMQYTLKRTDLRAGTVHIHFPRIGYILKKAEA